MSDSVTTHQRVMNMIARGKLTALDDGEGMQFAQLSLLRDETKARVERFQQYGFSSVPEAGSEAVVLFVGGGRDHGIVMAVDNRASRIRGFAEGEVAMYSNEGDYIVLKRGNVIEISADRLEIKVEIEVTIEAPKLIIKAPEIEIAGNIALDGDLISTGTITAPNGHVGASAAAAREVPGRFEVRGQLAGDDPAPSHVIGWAPTLEAAQALLNAVRSTPAWTNSLIIDRETNVR